MLGKNVLVWPRKSRRAKVFKKKCRSKAEGKGGVVLCSKSKNRDLNSTVYSKNGKIVQKKDILYL